MPTGHVTLDMHVRMNIQIDNGQQLLARPFAVVPRAGDYVHLNAGAYAERYRVVSVEWYDPEPNPPRSFRGIPVVSGEPDAHRALGQLNLATAPHSQEKS